MPFVQNPAVYDRNPLPFVVPTAWDKCPTPWERLERVDTHQKSGAPGVNKIIPARRHALAREEWPNCLCKHFCVSHFRFQDSTVMPQTIVGVKLIAGYFAINTKVTILFGTLFN